MKGINENGHDGFTLDVQVYKEYGNDIWAQAHYLVHGTDDSLWTNSIDDVIRYLREELRRIEEE